MKPSSVVCDVHSQLNLTVVRDVVSPDCVEAAVDAARAARDSRQALSVAGGRHAMGGQQFGTGTIHIDTSRMSRVLRFDRERGSIEVEAGIQWPELVTFLLLAQAGEPRQWGIVQKQTGADRFSVGGSLASNIHGRGLRLQPMVGDIESLTLVDAEGDLRTCSRTENSELFRLAIGGYGLFGLVAAVKLRLAPRVKLERIVEIVDSKDLAAAFQERIDAGFVSGDFQCSTAIDAEEGLRRGVFSCYRPVAADVPVPPGQRELATEEWEDLAYLAHADPRRAFELYADHCRSTSGQIYWSDLAQMSVYLDDYHRKLDRRLDASEPGTEMITEVYVPRAALWSFLERIRGDFRRHSTPLVDGTVRLIERDEETFLAWARKSQACIVLCLHCGHGRRSMERAVADTRRVIDRAIEHGGSFSLAYHRWATRSQIEACHPRFPDFLCRKLAYDPEERFQSDWYRQYRAVFADHLWEVAKGV